MGFVTTVQRKVNLKYPLYRTVDPGTAPNEMIAATETGSQTSNQSGSPANYQNLFEPGGTPVVGGDLADVGKQSYMVIGYIAGTGTSTACGYYINEGAEEFDDNHLHSGSLEADVRQSIMGRYPNPDSIIGTIGHHMEYGPTETSDLTATWGLYMGRQNHTAQQACMLVLPVTNDFDGIDSSSHGGGGILGELGVDVCGAKNASLLNPQSTSDNEASTSNTFEVPASRRNERWLGIAKSYQQKSGNGFTPYIRWQHKLDGEDFFNVRTDNTTGGSSKTGRGFQVLSSSGSPTQHPGLNYRVIENLRPGTHEYEITNNQDGVVGNTVTTLSPRLVLIRTRAFKQFVWKEVTDAVTVTSDSWSSSSFEVEVVADGVTPIWLGFSTSVHQHEGQVRFRLRRDTTTLTAEGSDYPTHGSNDNNRVGGTNGAGDTDNDTLPYAINWVDTPSAGTYTYNIQYRRNSGASGTNNAMFNTRDDGSSGFIGTIFAAELSFPTRQPSGGDL